MKLDYERIITLDEFKNIDIDEVIALSNYEYNKVKGLGFFLVSNKLVQRAIDLLNTKQYDKYSKEQKEVFKSNFIYNNDEKVIDILLSLKVEFDKLEGIMQLVQTFKILHNGDPKSPIFNDSIFKSTMELLEKLCLILQKEFKCDDIIITINKFSYIVSYQKDFYLSKQNGPTK